MSGCEGLHCAGCRDGAGKAVLVGGGILAVEWVASHAWEVLAVTAACGALAVSAVVALMRWGDRREARHMAEHPLLVTRAESASVTTTVTPQVSRGASVPAIENHYHIHLDPADREGARIIRTALPGMAGEATAAMGEAAG